jgi:hypothetical protein
MVTAAEYLLRADSCALAARMAQTLEQREHFLRLAAACRDTALRIQLGKRSQVLRTTPAPEELNRI